MLELCVLGAPAQRLQPIRCAGRTAALSPKAVGGGCELARDYFFTWSCAENSGVVVISEFALLDPHVEPVHVALELSAAPLAVTRVDGNLVACTSAGDVVIVDAETLLATVENVSDGAHTCASIDGASCWFGLSSGRVVVAQWDRLGEGKPQVVDLVEASLVSRLFKAWSPSFAVCAACCVPGQGGQSAVVVYGDGRVRLWSASGTCVAGASLAGDAVQLHSVVLSAVAPDVVVAQSHAPGALPQVDVVRLGAGGRLAVEAASADKERRDLKSFHARGAALIDGRVVTSWWSEAKVSCAMDDGDAVTPMDADAFAAATAGNGGVALDKEFSLASIRLAFAAATGRAADETWTMEAVRRAVDALQDRAVVWQRIETECRRAAREARQALALFSTSTTAAMHLRACGCYLVCSDGPAQAQASASAAAAADDVVLRCGHALKRRLKLQASAVVDVAAQAKAAALALPADPQELSALTGDDVGDVGDAVMRVLSRHPRMEFAVDDAASAATGTEGAVSRSLGLAAQDVIAQRARAMQEDVLAALLVAFAVSRGLGRVRAGLVQPVRAAQAAQRAWAVAAAALEACRVGAASEWASHCLGKPASLAALCFEPWPRFLAGGLAWMRDARHPAMEAVALKLAEGCADDDAGVEAALAQGLLHSAATAASGSSPEHVAQRRALLARARAGYLRAAAGLRLRADGLLFVAQQFERARDAESAMLFAEAALESGCAREAALFTVLAAVGADPSPDYAAALSWACEDAKYVRQLVMTMLARDHCAQLCALALGRDELDTVALAVDEALRAALADAPQPRLALACLAFFLRVGRYEAAAAAAYRLAHRLSTEATPAAMRLRSDALATCLTAMRLDPRVSEGGGAHVLVEDKGVHAHERRSVVRAVALRQVEVEYALSEALEVVGAAFVGVNAKDVVDELLAVPGDNWALALRVARLHDADMGALLSALGRACAAGRAEWPVLRGALAGQPWRVHGEVLDALLADGLEAPAWLVDGLFPADGSGFAQGGSACVALGVLLRRGRLHEAVTRAVRCVPSADAAKLAETARLRDAPWVAPHVVEFILGQGARVLQGGAEAASWGVVDADDARALRVGLRALERKLVDYYAALAKVEPARASMLRHL